MCARHFTLSAAFLTCLLAAGCAGLGGLQSGLSKPRTVVVSDFTFAPEVAVIDRGYTARLERKIGPYPTHERGQRTSARVNDEIVAAIVVHLREGGLDARPGGEDTLTLDQTALVLAGSLRPAEPVTDKTKNSFGFGSGRGRVVAAMNATLFSSAGRRELQSFNVGPLAARREPPVPPKVATARNAAIATIVAAEGGPKERLSPDVEVPARRLGRAIAERVIALAKEQGWLGGAADAAGPGTLPPSSPAEENPSSPESGDRPDS